MISIFNSVRVGGFIFLIVALCLGAIGTALWLRSSHMWELHLVQANHAGQTLFDSLTSGASIPIKMNSSLLSQSSQDLANQGKFEQIQNIPRPALTTNLTFNADIVDRVSTGLNRFVIISPDLKYPVSALEIDETISARELSGKITALIASYCSDATMFISLDNSAWHQVQGREIWGCEAAPVDRRLLAVFIILSGFFLLSGLILNASAQFSAFADRLRTSRQIGASETFRETGLSELNSIVEAMNHYRELEKKHLEERALVLSGVTHDLGTPALRLKFRAELIEDPELRAKLHKDIDQMTGILESVLTFTRAELSVEEPRQISLTSLVQSIVSDFKDFEQPVEYIPSQKLKVEGGSSLFMTRRSKTELSDTTQIVLKARPVALRRAVSNLVENAVKYGRRANVYLKADASYARIVVEDEGGASFPEELEAAMAPFKRGKNATPIKGFGLGLTIASSIALSHGGTIEFNQTSKGLAVQLSVSRSL